MRWRHKLQCGISIIDGAVEAAAAAAAASGSCHDVGHTQGHVERVHGRGQGRLYLVAGRGTRLTASKLFPVMMLPVATPSPTVCNSSSGVWLQSRLRVGLPAAWCHRAHRGRHASHPKAPVLLRFQNAQRRWPATKMVQCVQQGRIDCAAICPPCPPSLALLLAQPHFLTVLPTLRHSAHAARSLTYMLGFQTSEVAKHRLLYNFCRSGCYFT